MVKYGNDSASLADRRWRGAMQSSACNTTNMDFSFRFNELGPVRVYPRYGRTRYMSSVDAACVYEFGGPTHEHLEIQYAFQ